MTLKPLIVRLRPDVTAGPIVLEAFLLGPVVIVATHILLAMTGLPFVARLAVNGLLVAGLAGLYARAAARAPQS
jgi:hypothetical protein